MEKEFNKADIDFGAIEEDFYGFLEERDWDSCNAIIDNLRDLGEYSKGIELAKRLTARKMTVPADYGEEKAFGVVENQMDVITKGLIF